MKLLTFFCLLLLMNVRSLHGQTYHSVKVSELDFGADREVAEKAFKIQSIFNGENPAVTVRSLSECYSALEVPEGGNRWSGEQGEFELVFKLEDDQPVNGFVDLRADGEGGFAQKLQGFAFTFTPSDETVSNVERFSEIRGLHYKQLSEGHLPGTAWFKHRAGPSEEPANNRNWRRSELEDSFGIFSGGRAISENLALDRELILSAGKDGETIPLTEIKGITVPAIDWKLRLPEGDAGVDALSLAIPEDQHAAFAKSLPDLLALIERAEKQFIPAAQAYSVRSPFRTLATRYRVQMGLDVPTVGARLLPAKSVAITGGDPFFPQGTDVAFVMESDTPEVLYTALLKIIQSKAAKVGAAETERDGDGYSYTSFQTEDRAFSSHVWRMGGVVAVSNSTMQIKRLIEVAKKDKGALGATDEYKFFRHRYPLAEDETAFIFLSDATIRRWGGPELRIAASRRTRAVAALGELTSQALSGEDVNDEYKPLLGDAVWQDGRIRSSVFGSLDFVTPASELAIDTVTVPEKEAYERWRNGYENGWAQAFDPIAIRIRSNGDDFELDLSVMPLSVDSDFSEFVSLCGNAELSDMARWVSDESLFHAAVALDTKSETFGKYDRQIIEFLPDLNVKPLGWMTGSVSLDLEESLFWEATGEGDFDRFTATPLVLRIGSNSRLKLALFMTAIKNAVETSAPDSVKWETRKRGGKSYVVLTGNEMGSDFHIYYSTQPGALILTLREDSMLRAISRENHKISEEEIDLLPPPTQLMLDTSPAFLAGLSGFFGSAGAIDRVQQESWKALPILNEWHRKFADKDPLAVQFLHYGEDIFCPGGKGYRWNPEAMTMESVAFGFPSKPRTESAKIQGIMEFQNVGTSLKFLDDGLRATLSLGNQPKRLPTPSPVAGNGELLATAKQLSPLKDGMVLSYEGTSWGTKSAMTLTTGNIVRDGGKATFDVVTEIIDEGEEPHRFTNHYSLDEGLNLISVREVDAGGSEYSEHYLELPTNLVSGETTRATSKATSNWKEEGEEPVVEQMYGQHEIRVIGKEDIEVPAGRFPDSIRIEVLSESLSGGRFGHDKYLMWYHPEVGMVKFEYIEGEDSRMELQKVSMQEDK